MKPERYRIVTFEVPGNPVPQSRPRFTRGHAYEDGKVREYKDRVARIARLVMDGREPMEGAVMCKCKFLFEPPKSMSKKKAKEIIGKGYTAKKDVDNLLKAVMDAISGIVYEDDKQIVSVRGEKRYGYPARVEVEICEEDCHV